MADPDLGSGPRGFNMNIVVIAGIVITVLTAIPVVLQLRTAYTITYASNSTPSGNRRVRVRANREGASVRLSPVVNVSNP